MSASRCAILFAETCPSASGSNLPPRANSAISANSPRGEAPERPNGTIGTNGTVGVWLASDWVAFSDERAGIAEFDGGLPRAEAEVRAFECCVAEWLSRNLPAPTDPDRGCARCNEPETQAAVIVPFLAGAGAVWLHHECWPRWYAGRKAMACAALAKMAIAALAAVSAAGAVKQRRRRQWQR